jgi:hypothetical protein
MSHLTESGRERGLAWLLPRLMVGGIVAGVAILVVWELALARHQIAQSADEADISAIVGAPCPAVSAAAFRSALKSQELALKYVFDFNGDTFGRAIGDSDCDVAPAKGSFGLSPYDVCQFTGPAVLYVKTARGEFFYLPGVGRKATVMTPDGVARCVMAAPKLDY